MRRALVLITAASLSFTAACGDDSDNAFGDPTDEPQDVEEQGPTTDLPDWDIIEDSTTQPFTLDESAWGSDVDGATEFISTAEIRDDTAVLLGADDGMAVHRLEAVDLVTGELLWSLDDHEGDNLPGEDDAQFRLPLGSSAQPLVILDEVEGADWAVLVSYVRRGREDEHGLAALAAETGDVLWTNPVVPAEDGLSDQLIYEVTGNAEAVVAFTNVDQETGGFEFVVIDPADGDFMWEGSDAAAMARVTGTSRLTVAGETLLAQVPSEGADAEPGPVSDDQLPEESVMAWDAATGEERWDLSDRYPRSQVVAAAGDMTLVQVPADPDDTADVPGQVTGPTELLVLDVGTGEEVDSFGTMAGTCVTDREAMIACNHSGIDPHYGTFNTDDREGGLSANADDPLVLTGVHGDYLFVTGQDGTNRVLDRAGQVLDDDLPGAFIAMSDRYAVFTANEVGLSGPYQYAIYPISQ